MRPPPIRPLSHVLASLLALALATATGSVAAQAQPLGSAFTYQGELRLASGPATGAYDMQFRLFDAGSNGFQLGDTLMLNNVLVAEGLFSVPLDFGTEQFGGERQWLEVAISPAGGGSFEILSPRTELTATPYAWAAQVALLNSVSSASILNGNVGAPDINANEVQRRVLGTCPSGEGIQAINLDGSVICGALVAGSTKWDLAGNAGTDPDTQFLGTTDMQPLELRAGNARGLRIEPSAITGGSPSLPITNNIVAGSQANEVAAGVRGAVIAGGGLPFGELDPELAGGAPNQVTDHFGFVGGGFGNRAGNAVGNAFDGNFATVSGGRTNRANGAFSSIGGGGSNLAGGASSSVGGGQSNTASGAGSTVGGGSNNTASGFMSTVGGGWFNCAGGLLSWAGGHRAKVRKGTESGANGSGCADPALSALNEEGDRGTFVWADGQDLDFVSTGANQFLVRASGGVGINTNTPVPGSSLTVAGQLSVPAPGALSFGNTTRQMLNLWDVFYGLGVQDNVLYARSFSSFAWFARGVHSDSALSPGQGGSLLMTLTPGTSTSQPTGTARAQTFVNVSDRAAKSAFSAIDPLQILAGVLELPMASWSYNNRPDVRHLGPVAQDFFATFGLGEGDQTISTIDADGIALAAIQGLNAKLEAENAKLRQRLERLEALLSAAETEGR